MNKYVLVTAAAIIIISVSGGYYYVTLNASHIEAPSPGYLIWDPTYLGGNETKIFLVSTGNCRYGHYNWSSATWQDGEVHEGDPCFIINVTIRNDYTKDYTEPDELTPPGLYNRYIKLSTHLYNNEGRVNASDVTYPINSLHGGHVFNLEPQETTSFDVYMATTNKDINRYEIYIAYIGPLPEP